MDYYAWMGMTLLTDYPRFAQPFREELRENAERLARESGIAIEHIRKKNIRKEDLVKAVLEPSGDSTPGWSPSSRRWKPARAINRGTTSRPARPI